MTNKQILNVNVGNALISRKTIPIQTMLKNDIKDIKITLNKIKKFKNLGCEILRIAIPEKESIKYLKKILKNSILPIVADIHFDYKLAILAIEAGVHKVRINPGNIGNETKIKKVVDCLKEFNIPVRIGINSGSLPKHLINKYNNDKLKIMLESAKEEVGFFEKYGYEKIVLSFKSSNVMETININRLARKRI